MPADRRRDAATAATGAGLLATGGVLRHHGVRAAYPVTQPRMHAAGMLRATRGKRLFWGGTALGLLGLPPLAVGSTRLVRGDTQKRFDALVRKAEDRRSFWREGLSGTRDALSQRAQTVSQPVPTKLRALQLGVATGTGAAGSALARLALGRRGNALKPLLTPVAGGLSATASVPLSNRVVRRRYPRYEVTELGVRRKPRPKPKPVTAAKADRQRDPERGWWARSIHIETPEHDAMFGPHPTRRAAQEELEQFWSAIDGSTDIEDQHDSGRVYHGLPPWRKYKRDAAGRFTKADTGDYRGRRTSARTQRVTTLGAGYTPVPFAGPVAASVQAARYAPPGHKAKAAARHWAYGPLAGQVAGVAGAYAGAELAARVPPVARGATAVHDAGRKVAGKLPKLGSGRMRAELGRIHTAAARTKVARPLVGSPARVAGAIVGYHGLKNAAGLVGANHAISRNLADQRRYDAAHPVHKALRPVPVRKLQRQSPVAPGMTRRETAHQIRRKRRAVALQTSAGLLGLAGVGTLAVREIGPHLPRLARYVEPHKARLERAGLATALVGGGIGGYNALASAKTQRKELAAQQRALGVAKSIWADVDKSDRLATSMHEDEAHRLVHSHGGYGLRGPLPRGLNRDEKMRAYEARYIASGGHKAHTWQRRAQEAEVARNVGIAGGTLAGAAFLAAGSRRGRAAGRLIARHTHPKLQRVGAGHIRRGSEQLLAGAGTLAGAAELGGEWARHRRGSYTSAPGGVAASALSRMRAYSPDS